MSIPSGATAAAACSRSVLCEPARRLPLIARIFIGLRLHQCEVGGDDDVVREHLLTGGQVCTPVDAVVAPVDGGLEIETEPLGAVAVRDRPGDRARDLDGAGDAAKGEVALDRDVVSVALD